jgi:hypothetical protein
MRVSRFSSGFTTTHTLGNPPCLDPSRVSPTNQSSSSGEGPVTRILRIQSDVSWFGRSTHVSSLAKDRSVACGDLYLRLCLVSEGMGVGVMERADPALISRSTKTAMGHGVVGK